jgi:8-oxo-dGTP pyrophosphatase MutT (NUDIX family)
VPVPLALRRLAYRIAYRALQMFWFVARPHKEGVKCLAIHHGQMLLVRHTYGRRAWDVPGGAIKRGEAPKDAAAREMQEELGLHGVTWRDVGELHLRLDRRRDTIHLFTAELASPEVRLDLGELAMSGWFDRDALPVDLAPYVLAILGRALS